MNSTNEIARDPIAEILRNPDDLITIAEAARRLRRAKATVQNWIYSGRLRGAQGLVYAAGRPMICWPLFAAAFVRSAD